MTASNILQFRPHHVLRSAVSSPASAASDVGIETASWCAVESTPGHFWPARVSRAASPPSRSLPLGAAAGGLSTVCPVRGGDRPDALSKFRPLMSRVRSSEALRGNSSLTMSRAFGLGPFWGRNIPHGFHYPDEPSHVLGIGAEVEPINLIRDYLGLPPVAGDEPRCQPDGERKRGVNFALFFRLFRRRRTLPTKACAAAPIVCQVQPPSAASPMALATMGRREDVSTEYGKSFHVGC